MFWLLQHVERYIRCLDSSRLACILYLFKLGKCGDVGECHPIQLRRLRHEYQGQCAIGRSLRPVSKLLKNIPVPPAIPQPDVRPFNETQAPFDDGLDAIAAAVGQTRTSERSPLAEPSVKRRQERTAVHMNRKVIVAISAGVGSMSF